MKFFINNLLQYDAIGFDLDGTLYDEYEFISQAYREVANVITTKMNIDVFVIYRALCINWLKYGSSANIFQLTAKQTIRKEFERELISECVEAYRKSDINLVLPKRSKTVLEELVNHERTIFLVTDGNSTLQRKKIKALGLNEWFDNSRIAISGDFGSEFQKPSIYMLNKINFSGNKINKMIYIGDRIIDRQFAENTGMEFVEVHNMQSI